MDWKELNRPLCKTLPKPKPIGTPIIKPMTDRISTSNRKSFLIWKGVYPIVFMTAISLFLSTIDTNIVLYRIKALMNMAKPPMT